MPSLIFLDQTDYLPTQVVDFLTKDWNGDLLDLSEWMIVLPTQEARRRLHESLVRKTLDRGATLLPPVWILPMQLLDGGRSDLPPASLEQLLWMQSVIGMTSEEARQLFPRKSPGFDPAGATGFANSIRKLRGELAQAGISLGEMGAAREEDHRWKALVSLESRYLKEMAGYGYTDRITAQLQGIKNHGLPAQIRHLMIAGIPDLPGVYESAIPAIEQLGIPVTILSYDPLRYGASFFDSLGRPNDRWNKIPIPIEREVIHLCVDQTEAAERASLLAQASGGKGIFCAIAVTTTELARPIEDALTALKLPVFNPAGKNLDSLRIGSLLRHFSHQLQEDTFQSCLQLIRHPDTIQWLALDPVQDLRTLDELQAHLIPSSLDDLLHRWPENQISRINISESLQPALRLLQQLLSTMRTGHGSAPILRSLGTIYSGTDLTQIPGGKESVETIRTWVQDAGEMPVTMRSADVLSLLPSHLQSGIFTYEKPSDAIELPGWLELLWEDAPHLLIVGMNDGFVPETRQEDPFLNEKLRMKWGLASDHSRLRRDGYLLLSLMAARAKRGRIDLLLSRQDEAGSVLKPSRLLLRPKSENELPVLVEELFRELPLVPGEQWHATWALKPERKPAPTTLSASSVRDYLTCPTRFYLKQVLKMRKESFESEEANGAIFGVLLHDALRRFGTNPDLKNLRDEHQIESALVALWKGIFEDRFGTNLSFPLLYQLEAGIRRLRGAARVQSELRAQEWEIIVCERSFNAFPVSIAGASMMLRGQIDRIDRRLTPQGTEWRILDYKSNELTKPPYQQHIQALKKSEAATQFADYECLMINNKQHRWIDLQLPLYQMVLNAELALGCSSHLNLDEITPGPVEIGYLSLPAKISAAAFLPFVEIDALSSSAHTCLRGVLQSIHDGIFWPPRQPKYDDFQDLFFDHLEANARSGQQTLDPANLTPHSIGETES